MKLKCHLCHQMQLEKFQKVFHWLSKQLVLPQITSLVEPNVAASDGSES